MKTIELKEGQTARIVGSTIIIEDAFEPKDGDFVTLDDNWVSIYKSPSATGFISDYVGVGLPGCGYNTSWDKGTIGRSISKSIRPSTESEKQTLLDALDKEGLRWNAEEKRVEKKRWRAKMGEEYWRLSDRLTSAVSEESQHTIDNDRFKVGNYFQTEEEADAFAQKVRELYSQNIK